MLSGDLMGDLALLWDAIFRKIIKNRGCQSLFMLFFHDFGGKKTAKIPEFFTLIFLGCLKLGQECLNSLVLVSHMIKYDVSQQI